MLPHGALDANTAHLAIDLQRLFASGPWGVPGLAAIVPRVTAIARRWPERTIFTRFVVPRTALQAAGAWRRYYDAWPDFTGDALPAEAVDVLPEFAGGEVIDKPGYSAFGGGALHARLQAQGTTTIVVTGVETDVCVLSTVLQAVDLGYRVVVATDATASGSQAGHDATLAHVLSRLDQQVELAATASILSAAG